MKRNPLTIVIGGLLLLIFFLLLFVFQVRTTEVAVVTTFGKATRDVAEPGAYFKWPWPIQKVHKFDQRTHNFESKFAQALTADGQSLIIAVYAGWNISDPKLFFPRFSGSSSAAEESLEGLVGNAWSGVVGQHPFSHFVSTDEKELKFIEIEQEMLQRSQAEAKANNYGIDIKFIGIKKLELPESVTKLVFDRMKSERKVQETSIKKEGERAAGEIRSAADLESARLLSEAEAQAIRIRAKGEEEAVKSFEVFQQNPELAKFILSLTALEDFLKDRTTLILDRQTPPLNLLNEEPEAAPKK